MPWFIPSFLTPTFLVLGLLAISLPVLFHFFRRTPKGNVRFSTLRFLKPSPPRLTRRSRVDNWLLLLLRGLILLFIALAFGRIFFRQTDFLDIAQVPTRRVAILVDTSASMFRDGYWDQVKQKYEEALAKTGPADEVAVFAFDSGLRTLAGFSSDTNPDPGSKRTLLSGLLNPVSPRWQPTRLGLALVETVDRLLTDRDQDSQDRITDSEIILITDFQQGASLRELQSFEWPEDIPVELITVGEKSSDNASLSVLASGQNREPGGRTRVKVSNVPGSRVSDFEIYWIDIQGNRGDLATTVIVPPGQSRIVSLKQPSEKVAGVELVGDHDDFDNRCFLALPTPVPEKILFLGGEENVRNQLRFYLEKACAGSLAAGRRFEFLPGTEWDNDRQPDFIFVTGVLSSEIADRIREFVDQGGRICIVVTSAKMEQTVARLLGSTVSINEAQSNDYALISDIDFDHRIFSPFADPRYSNFSNIHFWKHRIVKSESMTALAGFDTGSLFLGEQVVGKGSLYLFSSGWHPDDSQFALSSKFVGVMLGLMLESLSTANLDFELGQPFELGRFFPSGDVTVIRPDGSSTAVSVQDPASVDRAFDRPGIFRVQGDTGEKLLAMNLPASESRTDRMETDLLEQENVHFGTMATMAEKQEKARQRKDRELESRQKLWRWMLVLALVTLFVESMLSGTLARRRNSNESAAVD